MTAITAAAGLVGAGLWAQWVEGSPRLMRPFGFYGGLFSVMAACWLAPDPWLMLGAYSVAGPWLQGLGRLRCLVQGCCHGAPADPRAGIRYTHPRSRVLRIAGLAGTPVHATPLYSIACNLVTALAVARLWSVGAPLSLIGGVFLIMNGLGRFVEEAYRGEPQTPVFAGLRMYQWIAIGTIVAGAAITTIPTAGAPSGQWTVTGLPVAALFGAIAALALGFDAPESNRRFGRLT
jgi:prolipoprotein diacylglyceryltransferase